jgi:signal peptidase II
MAPRLARSQSVRFYLLAAGVAVADQVTKAIARAFIPPASSIPVIPGLFDLQLSYNTAGAFGMMPNFAPLFIVVGLVAVYAIVRLRHAEPGSGTLSTGLGLLLGGAAGNLIDRAAFGRRGVTDFLHFHISAGNRMLSWPNFNLADAAIVAGILLVLYYVQVVKKRHEAEAESAR